MIKNGKNSQIILNFVAITPTTNFIQKEHPMEKEH